MYDHLAWSQHRTPHALFSLSLSVIQLIITLKIPHSKRAFFSRRVLTTLHTLRSANFFRFCVVNFLSWIRLNYTRWNGEKEKEQIFSRQRQTEKLSKREAACCLNVPKHKRTLNESNCILAQRMKKEHTHTHHAANEHKKKRERNNYV